MKTQLAGVVALVSKVSVRSGEPGRLTSFLTRLMMQASEFPGFLSADIIPPDTEDETTWALVQRFRNAEHLKTWRNSDKRARIFTEAAESLSTRDWTLFEDEVSEYGFRGNIATAIVTKIKPEADRSYRKWEAKIQSAQANFPGYRGAYMQPPLDDNSNEWITVLRFDTPESLDLWFASPERNNLLKEKEKFVKSTNFQRMVSSYPGWFPDNAQTGKAPARWKTMMLVLLCLYPIVVLESLFLQPLLASFCPYQAIFLGNIISVALITWALMPLVVKLFAPWLCPQGEASWKVHAQGALIILFLYGAELFFASALIK